MLKFSNDETSSRSHARNDHPAHSNANVNPRRNTMLNRSSILMLIAASMLATTALLPISASARGFGGGGGFHAPASPSIAATNFNRGTVKTAPVKTATVKTAPVQSANTLSFTRSTVKTDNSHSTTSLPH